MSMRTATMSNYYSPAPRPSGFFLKLVGTALFVLGIAGFMALMDVYQKNISSLWMMILATLSIGLAAGAAVRTFFYRHSGFTRFFLTLLAVPSALFLLGVLTLWRMGIGPLNPWARGNIPQDQLIQLGGAYLVAFICLEAWWKPRARMEAQRPSRMREPTPPPAAVYVEPRQQSHNREGLSFLPKKISQLKFMKASKGRSRKTPAYEGSILSRTARPARSSYKRLFSRKPNLQISMYEEHRCPFCLEEVKRNDPRGVKKCDVCNTLHHADCWAVTGMCQIPHLNT